MQQAQVKSSSSTNNVTIHDNRGSVAVDSNNFTQNVTNESSVDVEGILRLAMALRQAVPALGLPQREAEMLADLICRMTDEVDQQNPDRGRLARWGRSVIDTLNSPITSGALAGVLVAYAQTVLPNLQ
ncbi:hypothetical protein ACH437_29425 [Streptomyces xinghaiensis]|uniref:hypothetical protein n=1 Tax=Streptomyces xinghaiensis TaxID=1038928 RepID=UPI0037BD2AF0